MKTCAEFKTSFWVGYMQLINFQLKTTIKLLAILICHKVIHYMSMPTYQTQADFIDLLFSVPIYFDFILLYLPLLYSYSQKIQNFIYDSKTKQNTIQTFHSDPRRIEELEQIRSRHKLFCVLNSPHLAYFSNHLQDCGTFSLQTASQGFLH